MSWNRDTSAAHPSRGRGRDQGKRARLAGAADRRSFRTHGAADRFVRDVPFPGGIDLQFIIKELAKDLDLNVLFDSTSFRTKRTTNIELKNVTAARALDYIFLQEGLFSSRTFTHRYSE